MDRCLLGALQCPSSMQLPQAPPQHCMGRTWMLRVANSTPIVDLDSRQNSLRVKRLSRLDLPTPESPMSTTLNR